MKKQKYFSPILRPRNIFVQNLKFPFPLVWFWHFSLLGQTQCNNMPFFDTHGLLSSEVQKWNVKHYESMRISTYDISWLQQECQEENLIYFIVTFNFHPHPTIKTITIVIRILYPSNFRYRYFWCTFIPLFMMIDSRCAIAMRCFHIFKVLPTMKMN